jgi:hypothetical protein
MISLRHGDQIDVIRGCDVGEEHVDSWVVGEINDYTSKLLVYIEPSKIGYTTELKNKPDGWLYMEGTLNSERWNFGFSENNQYLIRKNI